jgi:hypothetical protein
MNLRFLPLNKRCRIKWRKYAGLWRTLAGLWRTNLHLWRPFADLWRSQSPFVAQVCGSVAQKVPPTFGQLEDNAPL